MALLGGVSSASACEPVLPFMQVVGGPAALISPTLMLIGAVVIKCVVFAAFQKKISFLHSALFMLAGNAITSVIGLIAGALISSGSAAAWLIGLPAVWAFCLLPADRLIKAAPYAWLKDKRPGVLASIMTGGLVVSCWLFIFAQMAMEHDRLALYWWLKIPAIYLALGISIVLTAFWEEWVVWKFSRGEEDDRSFVAPTIRANLLVLVTIMAVGTALMLPQRLKSPDYLASGTAKVQRR